MTCVRPSLKSPLIAITPPTMGWLVPLLVTACELGDANHDDDLIACRDRATTFAGHQWISARPEHFVATEPPLDSYLAVEPDQLGKTHLFRFEFGSSAKGCGTKAILQETEMVPVPSAVPDDGSALTIYKPTPLPPISIEDQDCGGLAGKCFGDGGLRFVMREMPIVVEFLQVPIENEPYIIRLTIGQTILPPLVPETQVAVQRAPLRVE